MYPWRREAAEQALQDRTLEWIPLLTPFTGHHPAAAAEWIAARRDDPDRVLGARHFKLEHLRFYMSDWIERATGARLFEFRNYTLV
jgi:hypothetical protein